MTTPTSRSVASSTAPDADRYDVVVVGARAAGAATAMLLARAGLRVLVVDRSRYGSDLLSTHALLRAGVVQLSRWGLLGRVAASGAPPVRSTVFRYGDTRVDVPIRPGAGFDALYAPRRTALDPILVDAAREAGAEVRFGLSVTGVCRDRTGRVSGITGHDSTGASFSARARVTVGADGMSSRIARLVGAPVERSAKNAVAFVYGYWDQQGDAYELFYRPGVAAGIFPTNDGQACVFAGTTPQRFRSQSAAGVNGLYRRLLDEVAPGVFDSRTGPQPSERLRAFTGRPGYLRRPGGPGWALVGDAGYFKDPITSHGISDALRDAELLARALVAAASGSASEPAALTAYQATRDRLSMRLFATTDAIASFTWDVDGIRALLKQVSAAMSEEVTLLDELGSATAAA